MANFINLPEKKDMIENRKFDFLLQQMNHDQDILNVQNIHPNK
jgi:hypothetical protein